MYLEYDVIVDSRGDLEVEIHLSPTLDTTNSGGIRLGVSLDEGPVTTLTWTLVPTAGAARTANQRAWVRAVVTNAHMLKTAFERVAAGPHTLKIWPIDDNVVLEGIVLSPWAASSCSKTGSATHHAASR